MEILARKQRVPSRFSDEYIVIGSITMLLAVLVLPHLSQAQLPADAVMLHKLKIPEKQKSADLCPVHLVASDPKLPGWKHKGVDYRGHHSDCKLTFQENPDHYAEAARLKRWEYNFVAAMSVIWCPVTDQLNPGGQLKWKRLGVDWENCCKFCNEAVVQEADFDFTLEQLKHRARLSYTATGGRYVGWGRGARRLTAYDKKTGEYLGSVSLPSSPYGNPITYLHQGKQWIAVTLGGGRFGSGGGGVTPELVALSLP